MGQFIHHGNREQLLAAPEHEKGLIPNESQGKTRKDRTQLVTLLLPLAPGELRGRLWIAVTIASLLKHRDTSRYDATLRSA